MDPQYASDISALKSKLETQRKAGEDQDHRLGTLSKLRDKLIAALEPSDLKWYTLELKKGSRTGPAEYSIQVCSPVFVEGFFVPVTAKETWELAVKFDALPLTRAVADQQVNEASLNGFFIENKSQHWRDAIRAYDQYANTLGATEYKNNYGKSAVAGSHKLWLLSGMLSAVHPCNYGAYHNGKRPDTAEGSKGKYLFPEYSVINGLIQAHDWTGWWDYSQLLQLMKGLKSLKDGVKDVPDLKAEIRSKNDAIWDETLPFNEAYWPGTKKF
jgi:hypothetical protein